MSAKVFKVFSSYYPDSGYLFVNRCFLSIETNHYTTTKNNKL